MDNRMSKSFRTSLWFSFMLSCVAMSIVLLLAEKDKARAFGGEGAVTASTVESSTAPAFRNPVPSQPPSADQRLRVLLRNLATPAGRVNPRAVRAVREVGSLAVPVILEELQDGDDAYQEALILCLGEIGDPAGLDPLLRRLARPGDPLKEAVTASLSGLISEEAAPRVLALLASEAPDVRVAALRVLCRTSTPDVTRAAIRTLLDDVSPDARSAALDLLGNARDESAPEAILLSLNDSDRGIRVRAVRLLGRYPCAGAREALKGRFSDDPDVEVRRAAAEALARL